MDPAHRFSATSYPLAYSVLVLPLSVPRFKFFSHHYVPSAATFFGDTLFGLSGVVNVLLFLIIRQELLLFRRPAELPEPEMELASESTGPAILPDAENIHDSPKPARMELGDEGSRNSAESRVSPGRLSDDI